MSRRVAAAAVLTALAVATMAVGRFGRINERCGGGRSSRGLLCSAYAYFEFAPADGAGMGSACACTDVTGAKGEVITINRGSSAMCSAQGFATTGIRDGDLVLCGSATPRVMPDPSGVLGVLSEPDAGWNLVQRSEQFNNAYWTKLGGATTSADVAIAPDGTLSADLINWNSTTAAGDSIVYASTDTAASGGRVRSIYAKGYDGGSGVLPILAGGAPAQVLFCPLDPNTWTRCSFFLGAASNSFVLGCAGTTLGAGCDGGSAVVWGAQSEIGLTAGSYIKTTGASATRAADRYSVTLADAVGPNFCVAASLAVPASIANIAPGVQLGTTAPNFVNAGRNTNTAASLIINTTATTPTVSAMGTTTHRFLLSDNAGTRAASVDGVSVSAPAASMSAGSTAVRIGGAADAGAAIITRIQVDPSPSACSAL